MGIVQGLRIIREGPKSREYKPVAKKKQKKKQKTF